MLTQAGYKVQALRAAGHSVAEIARRRRCSEAKVLEHFAAWDEAHPEIAAASCDTMGPMQTYSFTDLTTELKEDELEHLMDSIREHLAEGSVPDNIGRTWASIEVGVIDATIIAVGRGTPGINETACLIRVGHDQIHQVMARLVRRFSPFVAVIDPTGAGLPVAVWLRENQRIPVALISDRGTTRSSLPGIDVSPFVAKMDEVLTAVNDLAARISASQRPGREDAIQAVAASTGTDSPNHVTMFDNISMVALDTIIVELQELLEKRELTLYGEALALDQLEERLADVNGFCPETRDVARAAGRRGSYYEVTIQEHPLPAGCMVLADPDRPDSGSRVIRLDLPRL